MISCRKVIAATDSVFINIVSLLISLNESNIAYFTEFEQVNVYLQKCNVWSLKLFDFFIFIYCDCVRVDGNYFHKIFFLSRFGFSFFKLKCKTKSKLQIWISMFSYFKNRKTIKFYESMHRKRHSIFSLKLK